jgi:alpha-tubulin suppressor-like RCC1 family protein
MQRPIEPRPSLIVATPRTPTPPRPVTGIFAGHQHACALMDDRSLYCWGRNDRGQTSQVDRPRVRCSSRDVDCVPYDGDDARTWAPMRVESLSAVRSVALGESVSCATTEDGTLRCWGYHGAMRGEGSFRERADGMRAVRPVLGLSNARHVHLGLRGGCAVSDTGDVRCFNAGYLELETMRRLRSMQQVIEGDYQLCGWDGGDSLRCMDIGMELTREGVEHARFVARDPLGWTAKHSGREVCAWTRRGRVECGGDWGGYSHGTVRLTEVEGLRDVVQVAGGDAHYCARTREGAVWCWGSNGSGQLGDGTTVTRNVPVRVERLPEAVAIAAGASFNCAIVRDGRVMCWGDNDWGQLGGENRRESERTDPGPVLW